jgi:hypothetical protein
MTKRPRRSKNTNRRKYVIDEVPYVFKSTLECEIAEQLLANNLKWDYEAVEYSYNYPLAAECNDCGSTNIFKRRTYLADFRIFNADGTPRILEGKGKCDRDERKKIKAIINSNQDIDIRMVFQRNNWITKAHCSKYSDWCDKEQIKWAIKKIPKDWLTGCLEKKT